VCDCLPTSFAALTLAPNVEATETFAMTAVIERAARMPCNLFNA
jgi:hypothetical protein